MEYYGNILSDEMVGVVAMSRVPVMALTLNSPNNPLLAASRSVESTSLSLTVELNFRARSTITLLHLKKKGKVNRVQIKRMIETNIKLFHFINVQSIKSHTKRST